MSQRTKVLDASNTVILEEETLSDGSFVHNVVLKDGRDGICLECDSEEGANWLFGILTSDNVITNIHGTH